MLHRRSSDFFDVRDEADVPEDECWVEVIPAVSEEAVPLPELFFQRTERSALALRPRDRADRAREVGGRRGA